ncbi:hypothetical protein BCR44DRAFT_1104176 [Catenaria anguillulae PL171]|uniref:Uncharacterized protein n=1 Tax=Catenaria anguillulae PL171 TaxID=765915 RepID=A0A1Y2I2E1_9FUNG|nr:hypothetical protein BCR44DRAFT_1104176 [Catenaria anguillulae PL171]
MTSYQPSLAGQRRGSIPGLYPDVPGTFSTNTQRPSTTTTSALHFSPPTDHPMDIDELKSPEASRTFSAPPRQPLYPSVQGAGSVWDHQTQLTELEHTDAAAVPAPSPASVVTDSARLLAEQFARPLMKGQHELLDQERGVLMAYANMCEERYAELKSDPAVDSSPTSELATIKAEARAWLLFRTVVLRWLNAGSEQPAATLEDIPYFSAKVSAANAVMNDEDLVELKLVQTWLEESFKRTLSTAALPLYPHRA